jgi:hypothetical protein
LYSSKKQTDDVFVLLMLQDFVAAN